jgi:hypothetical protein
MMGRPAIDLTGKKFSRLTVIKRYYSETSKKVKWECICDCGNKVVVDGNHLRDGGTQSCGCLQSERRMESHTTHGLTGNRIYSIHCNMKKRCYNENSINYERYGARGITICNEWHDVNNFVEWAENNGYKDGLQIDRIDGNGNYEPNNCRWVTPQENNAVGRKRITSNNTSGFTGVGFNKNREKWHARITVNDKNVDIGFFKNIEDAVEARIKKEIEFFGEQKTNFHYKRERRRLDGYL